MTDINARITWNGHTGTLAGWTGPDTPDGGSHLGFAGHEPDVRCPCGWRHRIRGDRVESWGLAPAPAP